MNFPDLNISEKYIENVISNARNKIYKTSKYKGVSYCSSRKLWTCYHKGKYVGIAPNEEMAFLKLEEYKTKFPQ